MALFGLMYITRLLADGILSSGNYQLCCVLLAWYTFSIVYGRLYTGMHSFTDVTAGVACGAFVWAIYWACEDALESWIASPGWDGDSVFPRLGISSLTH
jgi:dihydrosphingosine 1-phosphate phosphatase